MWPRVTQGPQPQRQEYQNPSLESAVAELRISEVSSWAHGAEDLTLLRRVEPGTVEAYNKGSGISVLWVAMSRALGYPVFGDCVFEVNWPPRMSRLKG